MCRRIGFELALFFRSPRRGDVVYVFAVKVFRRIWPFCKLALFCTLSIRKLALFGIFPSYFCLMALPLCLLACSPSLRASEIGFVFSPPKPGHITIILSVISGYTHLPLRQIGFVSSNSFSQYPSRRTQYEINWLCFFKLHIATETRGHEGTERANSTLTLPLSRLPTIRSTLYAIRYCLPIPCCPDNPPPVILFLWFPVFCILPIN